MLASFSSSSLEILLFFRDCFIRLYLAILSAEQDELNVLLAGRKMGGLELYPQESISVEKRGKGKRRGEAARVKSHCAIGQLKSCWKKSEKRLQSQFLTRVRLFQKVTFYCILSKCQYYAFSNLILIFFYIFPLRNHDDTKSFFPTFIDKRKTGACACPAPTMKPF